MPNGFQSSKTLTDILGILGENITKQKSLLTFKPSRSKKQIDKFSWDWNEHNSRFTYDLLAAD
jgi:hypothetical protein